MNASQLSDGILFLDEYYAKTSALLKQIEWEDEGLTIPVVNELRAVGFHLLLHLKAEDDTTRQRELDKAIGHVKRAYFDINEIVLLYYLEELNQIDEKVRGYSFVLAKHIDEYSAKIKAAKQARKLISQPDFTALSADAREQQFVSLDTAIADLRSFIGDYQDAQELIWDEITQLQSQKHAQDINIRIAVFGAVATALGVIITLLFAN